MKPEYRTSPSYKFVTIYFLVIPIFCVLGFLIVSSYFYDDELVTNWKMTFAGEDQTFRTGEATDFQLFLENEFGEAMNSATVSVVFDRPETVHQIERTLHPLQNGLFETEVIFSIPGQWIAMIEAKEGNLVYRNQVIFQVDGEIISDGGRDPSDQFNLDQPLPDDIKFQLNQMTNFSR